MAMTCVNEERKYTSDGRDIRQVLIVADDIANDVAGGAPEALPVTGEGVDRVPDEVIFDIGSKIMDLATSTHYELGSNRWYKQN